MARRKVATSYARRVRNQAARLEGDAVALDGLFRQSNPMDLLAANLEAGLDREDLLLEDPPEPGFSE